MSFKKKQSHKTPKSQPPKSQPPKSQPHKSQPHKSQPPKSQTSKSQTPKSQTSKSQTPKSQTPKSQTSKSQTPKSQKSNLKQGTHNIIEKAYAKKKLRKEQHEANKQMSFIALLGKFFIDIAAIIDPKAAKEADATGDVFRELTKDILDGIKHGDLHELNTHLKQPKFKKEFKEAKAGLKNVIKGAKMEAKMIRDDTIAAVGDYGAMIDEVEDILTPLGLNVEKLERMGCDEVLGILEVSAACAEIMSFQKSAEVAMNDAEKAIKHSPIAKMASKANKIANKANNITRLTYSGGHIKKMKTKKKKYKKNKTKKKKH